MLAIGQEELENAEDIETTILCPQCGKYHDIKYGDEILKNGSLKPTKFLAFYKCKETWYLAGIKGKKI